MVNAMRCDEGVGMVARRRGEARDKGANKWEYLLIDHNAS